MLREKIVASVSRRVMIIADSSKRVRRIGAFPLPVEVVQFAWRPIAEKIRALGAAPELRMTPYGQPFVTDEGNYILDCPFGAIADPAGLSRELHDIAGVVEHGLFVNLADTLIVGRSDGVDVIERPRP
jgi:ribose 5-phosphate isomerase A